jgi:rare lipoprotein A
MRRIGFSQASFLSPAVRQIWSMHSRVGILFAGIAALGVAGCAQQPSVKHTAHSKEYFPSSIYGKASPRVVADGEPVPRGGGYYLVGKPYTIAGQTYYPSEKPYSKTGLASWYGDAFHGRRTANGEVYDKDAISAAHPTMPLPSYARVTNLHNNHSMIVRVNDRGPFHANRILDVSRRTAEVLKFHRSGTARVKIEYIGRASLAGSDDAQLLATLRTNEPATLNHRESQPSLVASASDRSSESADRVRLASDGGGSKDIAPEPLGTQAKVADVPLPPTRPIELAMKPLTAAGGKLARVSLR